MDLHLDHTQRLNLHFLMGSQRGSVDDVRFWWRLQDRIELSEEEKREVNFRTVKVGELDQPMWDLRPELVRQFEFSTDELNRIEKLLKEWPQGFSANDRRWLEPLLKQFEPSVVDIAKVNGSGANEASVQPRHRA